MSPTSDAARDGVRDSARDSARDDAEIEAVIVAALEERGLEHSRRGAGRLFVTLPGTKKQQTQCWLILTPHALLVEAFVCRRPDEEHEAVYRWLLQRNARLYGVHYTVDEVGDIHLVGRTSRHAVTDDEVDRILGQVLDAADGDFNTLLELGFASSIRREWAWRRSRGEPTGNLAAFSHLAPET